jgi:hypothetical protein
MQVKQEFLSGDEVELQDFVLNRAHDEQLVIVAGNPRIQALGTEGQLLVDNNQSTAVKAALDLYNYLIIQNVLSNLESSNRKHELIEALTKVNNWPFYVRGGRSHKAVLPPAISRNRRFSGVTHGFVQHFSELVREAKKNVKLAIQLDHSSGSSVHRFLTSTAEGAMVERHGGSKTELKRRIEEGSVDVSELSVSGFAPILRQSVFSPYLENSLAHSADVYVIPEGVIRGFMNQLAQDNDWGPEVNFKRKLNSEGPLEPYCVTRNIYGSNPDDPDALLVACPGVVAGTLGLAARDIVGTGNGKTGRILSFMEEDGRRVNLPELTGGTQFYSERIPGAESAPARFVITPPRDSNLLAFARFDYPPRCR